MKKKLPCNLKHFKQLSNWDQCLHAFMKKYVWNASRKLSHFSTHWVRVTHVCVSKLTFIVSDNGLSPGWRQAIIWTQCWNVVNWTLGSKLQWTFYQNSNIFFQENAFENIVFEKAAILSRPQCVNKLKPEKKNGWSEGVLTMPMEYGSTKVLVWNEILQTTILNTCIFFQLN